MPRWFDFLRQTLRLVAVFFAALLAVMSSGWAQQQRQQNVYPSGDQFNSNGVGGRPQGVTRRTLPERKAISQTMRRAAIPMAAGAEATSSARMLIRRGAMSIVSSPPAFRLMAPIPAPVQTRPVDLLSSGKPNRRRRKDGLSHRRQRHPHRDRRALPEISIVNAERRSGRNGIRISCSRKAVLLAPIRPASWVSSSKS
jgi:hypothetical protein